jgi:hypothetical protein
VLGEAEGRQRDRMPKQTDGVHVRNGTHSSIPCRCHCMNSERSANIQAGVRGCSVGLHLLQVKLDLSCLQGIEDDMDFCCRLAKEESVVVLPGVLLFS